MTQGIKVWDKNGNVTFSTEDITWNYLATYTVEASETNVVHNLSPLCSEFLVIPQMIDQVNGDDEAYVHTASVVVRKLTIKRQTGASAAKTTKTMFTVFGR